MNYVNELRIAYGSRARLIILQTREEERAIDALHEVAKSQDVACITWDCGSGFQKIYPDQKPMDADNLANADPFAALEYISKITYASLIVLKDFHEMWGIIRVKRKLRNLAQQVGGPAHSIVVISPVDTVPEELRNEAVVITLDLPSEKELDKVLQSLGKVKGKQDSVIKLNDQQRQKLLQAALGLSMNQARLTFSRILASKGEITDKDIDSVNEAKKQILKESGCLEYFDSKETLDDVGGLEELKEWLNIRANSFSKEARDFVKDSLKGIALIGIPGTGKSLAAKTIGSTWRVPVVRFDVGAVYGQFVGQSETNVRMAIATIERIAPCILWIDELEKAFAHGDLDGGTSKRVFGTLLTWMAEKSAPVFIVATANNIQALPPELLRKGRFDEIFFLNLPSQEERKQIFVVQLRKRERFPQDYDLNKLAENSEGYVGAEIEQAIKDALWLCHSQKKRVLTTDDILRALKKLIPLARSQKEAVRNMQLWLEQGRAISASYSEKEEAIRQSPKVRGLGEAEEIIHIERPAKS
ncbi:MAG: AAA family ATPase [Candidatus Obscuribacterales bacterium]|nr:AAA family ATPase [Candidatus Obscuribacterales bacterium]